MFLFDEKRIGAGNSPEYQAEQPLKTGESFNESAEQAVSETRLNPETVSESAETANQTSQPIGTETQTNLPKSELNATVETSPNGDPIDTESTNHYLQQMEKAGDNPYDVLASLINRKSSEIK